MNALTRRTGAAILSLLLGAATGAAPASLDDPVALEAFMDGLVEPMMRANRFYYYWNILGFQYL